MRTASEVADIVEFVLMENCECHCGLHVVGRLSIVVRHLRLLVPKQCGSLRARLARRAGFESQRRTAARCHSLRERRGSVMGARRFGGVGARWLGGPGSVVFRRCVVRLIARSQRPTRLSIHSSIITHPVFPSGETPGGEHPRSKAHVFICSLPRSILWPHVRGSGARGCCSSGTFFNGALVPAPLRHRVPHTNVYLDGMFLNHLF
ncbi:hypothetical protein F4780DRAFT_322070 [Xylariomycetidae sp. FL0641]|nr:hypothetical protein F4780DRAFT_322070 [Xylariomycetidae sp. FL0641]